MARHHSDMIADEISGRSSILVVSSKEWGRLPGASRMLDMRLRPRSADEPSRPCRTGFIEKLFVSGPGGETVRVNPIRR
jgi:hypothetical protein